MSTSQLQLYNTALGHLGERQLASLSENREPRRVLDNYYSMVVDECIEAGYWRAARRTVQLSASNSVTPAFGYQYAFDLPADCLQIYLVTASAPPAPPLNDWANEAGFLRAALSTLFVTYISNDASYGLTLSRWAPSFARWVAAELAARACMKITASDNATERMDKLALRYKRLALSNDAREGPSPRLPTGTWALSRSGRSSSGENA